MQTKRPPNLSLQIGTRPTPKAVIELQTPVEDAEDEDEDEDGYHTSSSSESQDGFELNANGRSAFDSDDISKDLALLAQLRRSVRNNLRLRPIRSASGSMRTSQNNGQAASSSQSSSPPESLSDTAEQLSPSPDSASAFTPASAYFTPLNEFSVTPLSAFHHSRNSSGASTSSIQPKPVQPSSDPSVCGITPALLLSRLSAPTRPLLIDTRPVASFTACHLRHSVNVAIPSLILRRSRKATGGFPSLDTVRQFITTEDGKLEWDDLLSGEDWDGDVIVYDQSMPQRDRHNAQASAWALMDIVAPLLPHGSVDYLEGGFAAARNHSYLCQLLVTGDNDSNDSSTQPRSNTSLPNGLVLSAGQRRPVGGLSQLDTQTASRSKQLPEIERAAPSPLPIMSNRLQSWNSSDTSSPSPAPSATVFSRPQPPRRPSIPSLRRLDTDYASPPTLPKLQVSASPNHLTLPISQAGKSARSRSRSPSHLTLSLSNHTPPSSARLLSPTGSGSFGEHLPPNSPSFSTFSPPRSPRTPMPRSPATARPEDQPLTTEEPFPEFTVSTILPNFLFLGPELTTEEHVNELMAHGVKRIVNIAAECDDDHGLHLRERFDRYIRIPMRDTVEEDNITKGVRDVCTILDDARLHSAPTYVHCKAGKSRSVTAVMAYLIHANHWPLSKAYEFVLDRRKGISPNIGFVSELMTFEEQELGGKSVGVVKMTSTDSNTENTQGGGGTMTGNYGVALGGRRPQHMRESLPPAFVAQHSLNLVPTMMDVAQLGDSQQEMEIKDSEGRYRHARRAPVDAATLQPMRRVSKAGLESSAYI
ncbi:hypothetical protein BDW22DRAFT_1333191 [Trametopsis cervina]|nr:hypothetical protein BDW22DRAFT_1333191 [Trametopsis cervina]